MGLIPVQPDFIAGTPIVASEVNRKFDDIIEVVNGGIDDANVYQLSADKITSGVFHQDRIPRLRLDQLPRDYNPEGGFRALSVRQPDSDPEYRRITWDDVVSRPATATRWPTWDEVTGKPVRFPSTWDTLVNKPATATRWPTWSEVTSKPSTFTPAAHNHSWSDITSGVPAQATRWPSWSEVTGKPTTFPPSAHSANLLTSGTVPSARLPSIITGSRMFSGTVDFQHNTRFFANTEFNGPVTFGSNGRLILPSSW